MAKAKLGLLRQVLADNIRRFRRELGISQEELAHRAKIHRTYMSSIERAQRNIATLRRLRTVWSEAASASYGRAPIAAKN